MKILFASPHRDLTEAYAKLLQAEGHPTVTAFEGTQVVRLAAAEKPDLVLLDESIPRIPADKLTANLHAEGIPVAVLTKDRIMTRHFLRAELPEAYLAFPFEPQDLFDLIRRFLAARGADAFCAGTASVANFRLNGARRVTLEETEFLKSVAGGPVPFEEERAPLADALNEKLRAARAGVFIHAGAAGYECGVRL